MTTEQPPPDMYNLLIVDSSADEAAKVREAMRPLVNRTRILEDPRRAYHELLEAVSGDGANVPDLLIFDADQMGAECWHVIRQLREMPEYEDAVVMVMSGDPSFELTEEARTAGASAVISKPLRWQTLRSVGRKLRHGGLAIIRVQGDGGGREAAT